MTCLGVTMATGSHCSHEAPLQLLRATNDELRREVSSLKSQLDSERNVIKVLKRKRIVEVKNVKNEEAKRYNIIINELETRLQNEKEQCLLQQKHSLTRKFHAELGKIAHTKDEELRKFRCEANKKQEVLHTQLRDALRVEPVGGRQGQGSTRAAGAPDPAAGSSQASKKLLAEVATLRGQKRKLEVSLQTLSDADRRKMSDILCLHEAYESEMTQLKKVLRQESHKLLEELKMKDRVISQLERELRHQANTVEQQREILEQAVHQQHKEGAQFVGDDTSLREKKLQLKVEENQDKMRKLEETHEQEKKELIRKLRETEDMQAPLRQKNKQFVTRNMELSARNRQLQDKVLQLRKEGEKTKEKKDDTSTYKKKKKSRLPMPVALPGNVSTSVHHSSSTSASVHHSSFTSISVHHSSSTSESPVVTSFPTPASTSPSEPCSLSGSTSIPISSSSSVPSTSAISSSIIPANEEKLKLQLEEKEKNIEALKQAARMSELQSVAESEKEMVDDKGMDSGFSVTEDSGFSVAEDNGLSVSQDSGLSAFQDNAALSNDSWNEFAKREYENMYALLSREHQALQRSYQLLQTQIGNKTDPQREGKTRTKLENDIFVTRAKIKDMEALLDSKGIECLLVEEKGSLNALNLALTEKIQDLQNRRCQLQAELQDCKDQNELLEFRVLELEECQRKVTTPDHASGPSSAYPETESDAGRDSSVHSLSASEGGSLDGHLPVPCLEYRTEKVEEVKEKLHALVKHVSSSLDKSSLLQAVAVLDLCEARITTLQADQSWQENPNGSPVEKDGVKLEEKEKQDHIILELEDTKQRLEETLKTLSEMKERDAEQERSLAALQYKEEVNQKTEAQLRHRVTDLQSQLESSLIGRQSENEMLQEKIHRITLLEKTIYDLNIRLRALQHDNTGLHDELFTAADIHANNSAAESHIRQRKAPSVTSDFSNEAYSVNLKVSSVTSDLSDCEFDQNVQHSRQSSGISCYEDKYDSLEQQNSFEESGIFDTDPCDFISQGTQTDFHNMEGKLLAEIPSLTSEIEKLTKFREAVESKPDKGSIPLKLGELQEGEENNYLMEALPSSISESISDSDHVKLINCYEGFCPDLEGLKSQCKQLVAAKCKVDRELSAAKNEILQLREQLEKFQLKTNDPSARIKELECQEADLKRQIQQMSEKNQQLLSQKKQLQEDKDELEEAENDARLRYQRLEEKLSSLEEDKSFLMEGLEEERRLTRQVRSQVCDLLQKEEQMSAELPYLETLVQKYEQRIFELEESEVDLKYKIQFLEHSLTVLSLVTYWRSSRSKQLALPSVIPKYFNCFAQTEEVSLTDKICSKCVGLITERDGCQLGKINEDSLLPAMHTNSDKLSKLPICVSVNHHGTPTDNSEFSMHEFSCQKDKATEQNYTMQASGTVQRAGTKSKLLSDRIDSLSAADQNLQLEMSELLHMNISLGEKLWDLNSGIQGCKSEDKNYRRSSDFQSCEEEPVEKRPRVSLSPVERIDSVLSDRSDLQNKQSFPLNYSDKESYYLEQIDILQKEKAYWRKSFEKEKYCSLDNINKIDEEKKVLEKKLTKLEEERGTLCHNLENLQKEKEVLELSLMKKVKDLEADGTKIETMHKHEKEVMQKNFEQQIEDLKSESQCYMNMVSELEGCLNTLRKELELVSVSKVTETCNGDREKLPPDTKTDWVNMKRKWRAASGRARVSADTKEHDLLIKIKELIRAETTLRCKVCELEKKESAYSETLQEADRIMAKVEVNYQSRISELETNEQNLKQRISLMEENEQRLRQALKVSGRNSEVHKIGELLDRLMETEKSELQLKEKVFQLEKKEKELDFQLIEEQKTSEKMKIELRDQEELVENLRKLECENTNMASEIVSLGEMEHRLQEVQQSEDFLKARVEELELTELSLKETLSQADNILMNREKKMKDEIKMLKEEVMNYKSNISDIQSNEEEIRREDVMLKKEVEGLRKKLREAEVKMKEKSGQAEGNEAAFRNEVTKIRSQLSLSHKQLNELEAVNSCLREEIKSLQVQLIELSGQVEEQRKAAEQTTIKVNLQLTQKDGEIEELTEKLDDMISQQSEHDLDVLAEKEGGMAAVAMSVEEVVQDLQLCDTCVQELGPRLRDAAHQLHTLNTLIRGETREQLTTDTEGFSWENTQQVESRVDASMTNRSRNQCIPENQSELVENLAVPLTPLHTSPNESPMDGDSEIKRSADEGHVGEVDSNKTDTEKVWDLESKLCVAEKQVQRQEEELKLLNGESNYLQKRLENSEEEVRKKNLSQCEDFGTQQTNMRERSPLLPGSALPPPSDFRITRAVGSDGLLLAWTPPKCDIVSGYEIFIDGEYQQKARSSSRTKALITGLTLDSSHDVSIISISTHGATSEAVHTTYHGRKSNSRRPNYSSTPSGQRNGVNGASDRKKK